MNRGDVLTIQFRGGGRIVAAEVYFGHLADVCRGVDLSGECVIEVTPDGRIYVNGLYVPSRQQARRAVQQPLLTYATGMR